MNSIETLLSHFGTVPSIPKKKKKTTRATNFVRDLLQIVSLAGHSYRWR